MIASLPPAKKPNKIALEMKSFSLGYGLLRQLAQPALGIPLSDDYPPATFARTDTTSIHFPIKSRARDSIKITKFLDAVN
jgi:hypothetical protein